MKKLLIIGAASDVGVEIAKFYAAQGYNLVLAARNTDELNLLKTDLEIRHSIQVDLKSMDLVDFNNHATFYDSVKKELTGVCAVAGFMAPQADAQTNWDISLNTLHVNYTGMVSILNIISNDFEQKNQGFIIGISSVAGDRGRKANYIYGSAKAGFTAYLSGLRQRLSNTNVHVLTVKPGFIKTKMTAGMALPPKLTATPEDLARAIYNAHAKKRNILYFKPIWFFIMLIIKNIPEFIFKKMSF